MTTGSENAQIWRRYRWVIGGLLIAVAVVVFLAPLASDNPDGLDRVAEDKGFADAGREPRFQFLADYSIPGLQNETVSTIVSGLVGVAVVFGLVMAVGYLARARKGRTDGSRSLPRTE
jgi:ABC-type Fe3+ transport system permease subunit